MPTNLDAGERSFACIIEATGYCDIYKGCTSFNALGGRNAKEAQANASLIAAAPELYETLAEVMRVVKYSFSNHAFYQLSEVAAENGNNNWLAKATELLNRIK